MESLPRDMVNFIMDTVGIGGVTAEVTKYLKDKYGHAINIEPF